MVLNKLQLKLGLVFSCYQFHECQLERHFLGIKIYLNLIKLTDSYENDIDPDNVNFQVLWPSTAAQYFHLLRRQMVRNFRKPGAVVMPKTLLRFSGSLSTLEDMTPGTCYQPVIDDTGKSAKKVIVTCGRHYFTLLDERKKRGLEKDVALVRLEQLVPFPAKEIQGFFTFVLYVLLTRIEFTFSKFFKRI